MTGGRLKRLEKYLKNETFLLTYGDGLSNVNIKKLIKFQEQQSFRNTNSCKTSSKIWCNKN